MIKVGIVGGAGYTAGELLRILVNHPMVEITSVQSTSHAGQFIYKVHRDLLGDTNLKFATSIDPTVDVVFLCSGHGKSIGFMAENTLPHNVKIIDLSNDFRLNALGNSFVYGLPELYFDKIKNAKYLANPGCFATAIELAFLPITQAKKNIGELHVTAITGSTGAGQKPTETSHFSWKNNNVSAYKIFEHQHIAEINQTLFEGNLPQTELNFIPLRGNFSRGIMATCYTDTDLTLDELKLLYNNFYNNAPFVILTNENPDVKQVVNTNKCVLYLHKHKQKALIISVIDNLVKGASGQAVQNMNIMFGLDQTLGLRLKPVAF